MSSDSEQQRLIERYSQMTPEQLQELASQSAELTDAARAALQSEIQRRGVLPSERSPDKPPEIRPDDSPGLKLVMVQRFRDLPEALLAKGCLASSGIESFLGDDNMVRLDWFISNLIGGIKLLVRPGDLEEANLVLNQPIPENFDVDGVGEYKQPRCPQCGSLDVSFEELNKAIAYGSAGFLHVPLPVHNRGWACHDCGNTWDGPAEEVPTTE